MSARLRALYGEGPLHLAAHLAVLAGGGWAVAQLLDSPRWVRILAWFVGAALVHDLIFGPLVALGDRVLRRALPAPRHHRPSALNHVRFVVVVAGVLLLVYFPLILQRAEHTYVRTTGREPGDYLARWLAVTGALALASALVYVVRRRRSARVDDLDDAVGAARDEDPSGA